MKNLSPIKIIECPRDAMQGLPFQIPTKNKIEYINQLIKIGFDTIDFGSFVNPKAVPQLADTEDVLMHLEMGNSESQLLAIVANKRGFDEAATHKKIKYLGYPLSISETFQQRNTNKSIKESFELIDYMSDSIKDQELVVYLSMCFGNPYGDEWNYNIVMDNVRELLGRGVNIISLADTTSLAKPIDIFRVFSQLIEEYPETEFGAHFHSSPELWQMKVEAAYDAGCRRFDTALLGYGGCPFAEDELVGNTPTELFFEWLEQKHASPHLELAEFEKAKSLAKQVFSEF